MVLPVSNFTPYFVAYVKVQLSAQSVMSPCVLFFFQYWACRYDVLHCLTELCTESPFAVYFCCNIFVALLLLLLLMPLAVTGVNQNFSRCSHEFLYVFF